MRLRPVQSAQQCLTSKPSFAEKREFNFLHPPSARHGWYGMEQFLWAERTTANRGKSRGSDRDVLSCVVTYPYPAKNIPNPMPAVRRLSLLLIKQVLSRLHHIRILLNGTQGARPGKFRFVYAQRPAKRTRRRESLSAGQNPQEPWRVRASPFYFRGCDPIAPLAVGSRCDNVKGCRR